jgi:histidinol-phosphate aminotransferase
LAAVRKAVDGRLRRYPDPIARALREQLARLHGCASENVVVGNGADEVLALAVRAFVDPAGEGVPPARSTVQFLAPSYSLYPVLAEMHGARPLAVPLRSDFGIPGLRQRLKTGWRADAALTFVTTPNAPSGRAYTCAELGALCRELRGVVVLDEAYADFAREQAVALAVRHPHVMVARTFSKAYSLCFQRVGYLVGSASLIQAIDKIRDSYNVNGLGQVAALAALRARSYYRRNFKRIIATRERCAGNLVALGFQVFPSQTNFLLVLPPRLPAEQWMRALRERRVLVRWFPAPEVRDYLRITIGTDAEMDTLIGAIRRILA